MRPTFRFCMRSSCPRWATEPIAVAYAGALARQTLGTLPERIELTVSGNIIKNVKSVIVPHTGGRKGLPVAVAAGGTRSATPTRS